MLRKFTQESGSVVRDRVLSSSSSQSSHNVSLKAFSTWLDVHHSRFSLEKRPEVCHSLTKLPQNGRRFASTRHSLRQDVEMKMEREDFDALPRFLKRQHLQKHSTPEAGASSLTSILEPRGTQTFRSRHYNPRTTTPSKSEIRLLEPHVLSGRLKKLCDVGKIDDAVYMLKNAPLDAQNTQVWNTLIWECLKGRRFQLGYQLFVDMKRRGFSPTTRTYQTLFTGLSKIDHWATHPKQFTNARSLYQSFQRHIESLKKHDPTHRDLVIAPLGAYIRILGKAGYYRELFDVFYEMDQDGPLMPTQYIYTELFEAIVAAKKDTVEGRVKAASDARMLWNQMIRHFKRANLTPDSHLVISAIRALSGGVTTDHDLAFNTIQHYFGLVAGKTVSEFGQLSLAPESLAPILQLCNQTQKYTVCREFLVQVKRRPAESGGLGILDKAHIEEGLKAEIALREPGLGYHALETLEWMLRQEITADNGPRIRPATSTYNLVMQACWRSADWRSATRTFDLMTGYHAHDFMDGSTMEEPRFDKRGRGRNLPVTTQVMSLMLLTAQLTKSRANMRQALRIVDFVGFDKILSTEKQEPSKLASRTEHYAHKFAQAVSGAVEAVTQDIKHSKPEEIQRWTVLGEKAKKVYDVSKQGPSKVLRPSRLHLRRGTTT